MPSLHLLIHDLHPPSSPSGAYDPTDLFAQSLSTIFSDARNQHGEPGEFVLYTPSSADFLPATAGGIALEDIADELGDAGVSEVQTDASGRVSRGVKLGLANPSKEDNRFFAHFLWNAGIQASEMVIAGEFQVRDMSVLELGAGAGCAGIICALAGARRTVLTDYPADAILEALRGNVERNIPKSALEKVEVKGHMWGVEDEWLGGFDRVVVADCMWLAAEHENLVASIRRGLADDGVALAVAGFHTGRSKVAGFLEKCEEGGLILEKVFERDVEGVERVWVPDRGPEDPIERKRWLTISYLKKKL